MANNAFSQTGATPGVLKPKTIPGISITPTPGSIGGSYNPNQGAIGLGQNPGLISPHPTVKAQTPLKKTTTTDTAGNTTTHEYHAPAKTPEELAANTKKNNQANYNPPTQPLTVGGQAPQVAQAGQQTPNESQYQQQVSQAGQTTPDERAFQDQYVKSVAGKQFGQLAPYAESSMYAGKSPEEIQGLITAPDLAGRANANTGLYNQLGSAYGNAALAGLTAAQTSAARNLQAQQSAYSGAQTTAQRGLAANENVLGAVAPQQVSPTNVPYLPGTNTYGQPASSAYGAGGLSTVGGFLQQQDQGAQTQVMIGAYNQAKPLIETAKQQIASSNFNASPLALANQLQQYVNSNVVPSGEYANIFNTLSEIATTISPVLGAQGAQTDLKTMIAQNFIPQLLQGKDITSVFDNIEKNALAKISANKSTATGTPLQVPNAPTTSGGGNVITTPTGLQINPNF